MSIERYYNEVVKFADSSGQGLGCKTLVQALLEVDDGFTLVRTDSDTSSKYDAWVRVYNTKFYWKIYNSGETVYVAYYDGLDGNLLHSASTSRFFNSYTAYKYRATVSKLGDFGLTVSLSCNYTTDAIVIGLAKFVADLDGMEYDHISISTVSNIGLTGYGCRSPFSLYGRSIRVSDGLAYYYTPTESTLSNSDIYNAIRESHFLKPKATILYNTSSGGWLGHVKWGGKYDIYCIQTVDGDYSANPNANYVVDGVTYKAAFNVLLIPVECT